MAIKIRFRLRWVAGLVMFLSGAVAAVEYAGQETRRLKAFAPEEIDGYLAGRGMGFAKPAELNGYPGPKHVLALAKELQLTELQARRTQQLFDSMQQRAAAVGRDLLAKEEGIEVLFRAGNGDVQRLKSLLQEAAALEAELRLVHLQAHLEQKVLLTQAQSERYNSLRGYASHRAHHH